MCLVKTVKQLIGLSPKPIKPKQECPEFWAECNGAYFGHSTTPLLSVFMLLAVVAEEEHNYEFPDKIIVHRGNKVIARWDQAKWREFYRKCRREDDE